MKMTTYVNFPGTCAEAFRFYEQHLGGKIGMMMTHAQAPDQSKVNPDWKDAVLHARLSVGGTELLGADIPKAQPMRSAYLSLARRERCRGGAHLFGARRGWRSLHADAGDVLRQPIWPVARSVRPQLDDSPRAAHGLTAVGARASTQTTRSSADYADDAD